MPRLTAAEEFLAEEEPLELPIRGKVYTVPPIDAERWLRLMALDAVGLVARLGNGAKVSEEDLELVGSLSQADTMRVTLGDALDAMVADGVPAPALMAASRAAAAFHRWGLERAEQVWRASLGEARGGAVTS